MEASDGRQPLRIVDGLRQRRHRVPLNHGGARF
jgi:hypothetical protein